MNQLRKRQVLGEKHHELCFVGSTVQFSWEDENDSKR